VGPNPSACCRTSPPRVSPIDVCLGRNSGDVLSHRTEFLTPQRFGCESQSIGKRGVGGQSLHLSPNVNCPNQTNGSSPPPTLEPVSFEEIARDRSHACYALATLISFARTESMSVISSSTSAIGFLMSYGLPVIAKDRSDPITKTHRQKDIPDRPDRHRRPGRGFEARDRTARQPVKQKRPSCDGVLGSLRCYFPGEKDVTTTPASSKRSLLIKPSIRTPPSVEISRQTASTQPRGGN